MEIEIMAWLKDIEQAIDEIKLFVPEPRNFKTFQNDLKTKRAAERNVEIIGEAVNRILKFNPKVQITMLERLSIRETELSMVTMLFRKRYCGEL